MISKFLMRYDRIKRLSLLRSLRPVTAANLNTLRKNQTVWMRQCNTTIHHIALCIGIGRSAATTQGGTFKQYKVKEYHHNQVTLELVGTKVTTVIRSEHLIKFNKLLVERHSIFGEVAELRMYKVG